MLLAVLSSEQYGLRGQRLVSANKSSWWSCMDALCFSHATRFETTSLYHNQITAGRGAVFWQSCKVDVGKRSASGRSRTPVVKGGGRRGHVVNLKGCPHVHADPLLVHQAAQAWSSCNPVFAGGESLDCKPIQEIAQAGGASQNSEFKAR